MIKSIKELKDFFTAGGKVKMTFHQNTQTRLLGTTRGVIRMSPKEWEWEGGSVQPPLRAEDTRFDLKGYSVLFDGKPIITYEYVTQVTK